jgi:hypothetical protein
MSGARGLLGRADRAALRGSQPPPLHAHTHTHAAMHAFDPPHPLMGRAARGVSSSPRRRPLVPPCSSAAAPRAPATPARAPTPVAFPDPPSFVVSTSHAR